MRLFRKQFVISKRIERFDETWTYQTLSDGWFISYQSDLDVHLNNGTDGRVNLVLGHRYCYDPVSNHGAGRYIEICWPTLTTDPAALLGVFYGHLGDEFVVSSSPELAVRALTGEISTPDINPDYGHRSMINYLPSPGTVWRATRRLLPDQAVDFGTRSVVARENYVRPLASFDAALDAITESLCEFAQELKERIPGRVILPLTGGLDSRFIAASFLAVGLPFETTTLRFVGKPKTDFQIARRISKKLGIRHHLIDLLPIDQEKVELCKRHVSNSFFDWDITHTLSGGAFRYQRPGDAMIPGMGYEIAFYYADTFARSDFETIRGEAILRQCHSSNKDRRVSDYLDDWLDWRRRHQSGLPWNSQFYLDQRLGAWRASIEQVYDMLPAISLNPGNSHRVFSALMTPSLEQRTARELQYAAIRRMAPELLKYPVNPPPFRVRVGSHRRKAVAKIKRILGGLFR